MLPGGANLLPFSFIFSGDERWQWKTLTFSLTTLYPWLFTTLKSGKIYSRFYKYFDFMHLTNIMEGKSKPDTHTHTYLYRLAQDPECSLLSSARPSASKLSGKLSYMLLTSTGEVSSLEFNISLGETKTCP